MRLLLIVSVLLSGCSHSGKALNVAVVGAGVADLVTTRQVINGGGYEANPLAGDGAVRQAVLKAASATGVIGIAQLLNEKGHPILANIVRSVAVVLWSAASISNARQR